MEGTIDYCAVDTEFELGDEQYVSEWVNLIASRYDYEVRALTFVFCTDNYLLELNQRLLAHEDYTDVITVPYHESEHGAILGDVYISVERVAENAQNLKTNFIDELHRVMIHGVLHLCGMTDLDEKSKANMRNAEDLALNLRMF